MTWPAAYHVDPVTGSDAQSRHIAKRTLKAGPRDVGRHIAALHRRRATRLGVRSTIDIEAGSAFTGAG